VEDTLIRVLLKQTEADAKIVVKLDGSSLSGGTVSLGNMSEETSPIGMATFFDLRTDTTYLYRVEYREEILANDAAVFRTDSTIRLYLASVLANNFPREVPGLYPNPTQDFLLVEGAEGVSDYKIFDLQGRAVLWGRLEEEKRIRVSGLAAGIYVLKADPLPAMTFTVNN
jgi:hypothetical protein